LTIVWPVFYNTDDGTTLSSSDNERALPDTESRELLVGSPPGKMRKAAFARIETGGG
jgi:hypothetical protein